MTRPAVTEPTVATAAEGLDSLPGVRTLRSPVFRTMLAGTLLLVGAIVMAASLTRQAAADDGQFAIDFGDYHRAALRMADGATPYAPEMLLGPIDSQGLDRYRYPPPFAQLLGPLAGLGLERAASLWLLIQATAVLAAMWAGTGIGGARRSPERLLWCGVAAVFYLPFFDTLWKGNVSGVLALSCVAVALGGVHAGLGATFGTLLKAVPATMLPAALVADSRSRWTVVLGISMVAAVSFTMAPGAWFDYAVVMRNLVTGSSDHLTNLAPGAVVGGLASELAGDIVRLGSLVIAVVSLGGSTLLARDREGLPAAALLGTIALLLIPGSLWYHYLVILLPFAAMAWPRAPAGTRGALLASGALISVSLVWLPLALAGATLMAALSLVVLWPRPAARSSL